MEEEGWEWVNKEEGIPFRDSEDDEEEERRWFFNSLSQGVATTGVSLLERARWLIAERDRRRRQRGRAFIQRQATNSSSGGGGNHHHHHHHDDGFYGSHGHKAFSLLHSSGCSEYNVDATIVSSAALSLPFSYTHNMKPKCIQVSSYAAGNVRVEWRCSSARPALLEEGSVGLTSSLPSSFYYVDVEILRSPSTLQRRVAHGRANSVVFIGLPLASHCRVVVRHIIRGVPEEYGQLLQQEAYVSAPTYFTTPVTPRLEWLPPTTTAEGTRPVVCLLWEDDTNNSEIESWEVQQCEVQGLRRGEALLDDTHWHTVFRSSRRAPSEKNGIDNGDRKANRGGERGENGRAFSKVLCDSISNPQKAQLSREGTGMIRLQFIVGRVTRKAIRETNKSLDNETDNVDGNNDDNDDNDNDNASGEICSSCASKVRYVERVEHTEHTVYSFRVRGLVRRHEPSIQVRTKDKDEPGRHNSQTPTASEAVSDERGQSDKQSGRWSLFTYGLSFTVEPVTHTPLRRVQQVAHSAEVKNDASVAAVIAACGRVGSRVAMEVVTGIATGWFAAVVDISCAAVSAAAGAVGRALRNTDIAYRHGPSALAAGVGIDLGGGFSFRGAAISALLDDISVAARHGELMRDEADLIKRILQDEGIDNGRRVATFLLQRRHQQCAHLKAAGAVT